MVNELIMVNEFGNFKMGDVVEVITEPYELYGAGEYVNASRGFEVGKIVGIEIDNFTIDCSAQHEHRLVKVLNCAVEKMRKV
jgi:hypothetical protein